MLGFILLILFIVIIWPLVSIGWRIWHASRSYRDFMRDPAQFMRDRAGASTSGGVAPRKRKKISRDTGEYIAFTEIENTTVVDDGSTKYTEINVESQVTDIEWEDL